MDIRGSYQPVVYAYVVPQLGDNIDLVVGIPWLEHQRIVVEPEGPQLRLPDGRTVKRTEDKPHLDIRRISTTRFAAWQRKG